MGPMLVLRTPIPDYVRPFVSLPACRRASLPLYRRAPTPITSFSGADYRAAARWAGPQCCRLPTPLPFLRNIDPPPKAVRCAMSIGQILTYLHRFFQDFYVAHLNSGWQKKTCQTRPGCPSQRSQPYESVTECQAGRPSAAGSDGLARGVTRCKTSAYKLQAGPFPVSGGRSSTRRTGHDSGRFSGPLTRPPERGHVSSSPGIAESPLRRAAAAGHNTGPGPPPPR